MGSLSSAMLRGLVKNKMERVNKEISQAAGPAAKVEAYRRGMAVPAGALVLGKYDISEAELGGRPVTWISRELFPADRVILYLHGGGYIGGSVLYSRNGAASLAVEIGSKLAALEYRLAPEHPWPAALEDSLAAYEQLLTDGIPAEGIAIIGESAGGGLALATVLAARERGLELPAAVAVLSPWCDLTMSNITLRANAKTDIMLTNELLELASTLYTDGANRDNPLISPLFGDYSNFPPVLFQVAAEELLLGEIIQTANRAAAQSPNEVALEIFEGMWHVWQTMDEIVPEARQAVEKIGVFLNKYLPGHKNTVNVDTDKISGHMYKNKAGTAESSEQKS